MNLNYISTIVLLSVLSFVHTNGKNTRTTASSYTILASTDKIDYILFGIYCGECSGHCATMFQYYMMGNTNNLLVDSSDSYFKNNGNISCKTPITDRKKIILAESVVEQIPNQLLTTSNLTETFGCPDCTDGCGIYFEFRQEGKIKKFYIDNTSRLPKDIQTFGEFLASTIMKLNKN